MAYQMAVHSGYFALLHFLGGFPTGKSGFPVSKKTYTLVVAGDSVWAPWSGNPVLGLDCWIVPGSCQVEPILLE